MATDTIAHSIDAPGKARGMDPDPEPEIPAKARRRQFSARYKAETLARYDQLPKTERGASHEASSWCPSHQPVHGSRR